MDCPWSREVDLSAAVRDRGDRHWNAFDVHHTECAECHREYLAALRLDALVRAALRAKGEHPSDHALASLLEAPHTIERVRRRELLAHIDICPICRDAVVALIALERD